MNLFLSCLFHFTFSASSDHLTDSYSLVATENDEEIDPEYFLVADNHFDIIPPPPPPPPPTDDEDDEIGFEVYISSSTPSNFFTIDDNIYQNWRVLVVAPISSRSFEISDLETNRIATAMIVVDTLVFRNQLIDICEMWEYRMATFIHGPGGGYMRSAVVRALTMFGIMDQLSMLQHIQISANFSFSDSVVSRFTQKQVEKAVSLTFKMEIMRVSFITEKLRIIAFEEDLCDDDFPHFVELIGDIGFHHRMPWFLSLWNSD